MNSDGGKGNPIKIGYCALRPRPHGRQGQTKGVSGPASSNKNAMRTYKNAYKKKRNVIDENLSHHTQNKGKNILKTQNTSPKISIIFIKR